MSKKLKELKEKRAGLYTQIDALRKETDGRALTSEEQTRWDALIADYDKADKAVEAEERFLEIERRQAEEAYRQRTEGGQSRQIRISSLQGDSRAATHSSSEKADFFFVCFF